MPQTGSTTAAIVCSFLCFGASKDPAFRGKLISYRTFSEPISNGEIMPIWAGVDYGGSVLDFLEIREAMQGNSSGQVALN